VYDVRRTFGWVLEALTSLKVVADPEKLRHVHVYLHAVGDVRRTAPPRGPMRTPTGS
jgi:hypothetical protein